MTVLASYKQSRVAGIGMAAGGGAVKGQSEMLMAMDSCVQAVAVVTQSYTGDDT